MMTTDHVFFIQIINGKKDLKKLIYLLQLVQQMKYSMLNLKFFKERTQEAITHYIVKLTRN